MIKKKVFLVLLIICLIFQVNVYATDLEENATSNEDEIVTPPIDNPGDKNNEPEQQPEQEPEKEPEQQQPEQEPEQQEPSQNNTPAPSEPSTPTYEPQYTNSNVNKKVESENANLKSLVLEGKDLAPEFKASVTEYTAIVGLDVETIKVIAEAEDSNATVIVNGNENLEEGENKITITVQAEAGNRKVYTIIVTKTLDEEAMNARLKSLIIQGFNIYPSFQNNIYNYNLNINEEISKLDILAETENEKANFVIEGNENLKDGDNLIRIIVTAENGETTNEYKINVFINSNVVKVQAESKVPALILLAVLIVTAIIIAGVLIKKRKN